MDPCNVGPKERHITWSVQKRLHSRWSVLGLLQANVTTELDTFLVPGFSCKAHTQLNWFSLIIVFRKCRQETLTRMCLSWGDLGGDNSRWW